MSYAARNAAHFAHYFSLLTSGTPKVRRTDGEGWYRAVTEAPHPFGNFVVVHGDVSAEMLRVAVSGLAPLKVPSSVFFTSPEVEQDRAGVLADAGYESVGPMPLMAVEIDQVAPTALPDGVEFRRLKVDDLADWTQAIQHGYDLPPLVAELCADVKHLASDDEDSPLQFFGAVENGRVVSTSQLFLHDELAGIYCVATLPEVRGRGLGAHVTAEPLRRAAKLGYRAGILQSTAMGLPVYQRIGFEVDGGAALFMKNP